MSTRLLSETEPGRGNIHGSTPGFEVHLDQHQMCKLTKALYGLKQAPIAWFAKLIQVLQNIGFLSSKADNFLFIRHNG